jgi:hypothetical protein
MLFRCLFCNYVMTLLEFKNCGYAAERIVIYIKLLAGKLHKKITV